MRHDFNQHPHLRIVERLRRRWRSTQQIERASAGWLVTLIPAGAVVLLIGGSPWWSALMAAALGAGLAMILPQRAVTLADAADRVDQACGTRELFGTVLRLDPAVDSGAVHLLRGAADAAAMRIVPEQIPVSRRARTWWGLVAATTLLVALGLLVLADATGGLEAPSSDGRFAHGATLLAQSEEQIAPPDAGNRGVGITTQVRRRVVDHDSEVPADRRQEPSSNQRTGAASTGDAAAGGGVGGGAAESTGTPQPERLQSGESWPEPPASIDALNGNNGRAQSGGLGSTPDSGSQVTPVPTNGKRDSALAGAESQGGEETVRQGRVPPEYRELVRRYFEGGS